MCQFFHFYICVGAEKWQQHFIYMQYDWNSRKEFGLNVSPVSFIIIVIEIK